MKVNILGINFDAISLSETVEKIETMIKKGGFHQVGTINPEYVVKAQDSKQLMRVIAKMDLVVPDGIGIILAARIKRLGKLTRIRGGDLVERLAELSEDKGYRIGLVGGEKGVAQKALKALKKKFPRLEGFADSARRQHLRGVCIKKEKPQILLAALGFKGPVWIEGLRKCHLDLVGIEVGGVFNYLAGKSKKPAVIIQKIGLEWLWRLITEPWRWKRQLSLVKFLFLVFQEAIKPRSF